MVVVDVGVGVGGVASNDEYSMVDLKKK